MAEDKSKGFVGKVAAFVVEKRTIFFLFYIIAFVFCIFSMNWVEVENDVITYLPEDTETRQGIDAMNENFTMFGTAQVMVSNITYEKAQELNTELSAIEGISMVVFDDTADHYVHASALYDLNFAGGNFDQISLDAIAQVRALLEGYDVSIYTAVGEDMNEMLDDEMGTILVVAVVLILVVLTLTSRAYMEVPVLLITFGAAALMNMGTNFVFGKISFISDSIAVVLQLALAIDYAIILCHRFSDEHETLEAKAAAIEALRKAIPEISASSLTTISGLAALGFMKFKIGLDMSVVLMKSILLSLLSVFTLMPGLLVLFSPLIDKTKHRKLLPDVSFLGKFAVKTRRVIPVIFIVLLGGAFWLSSNCPYAYSFTDLKTAKFSINPYNVNAMTMAAGVGALQDEAYTRANCRTIMDNRAYAAAELTKLGFVMTDSMTNFLFVRHPDVAGGEIYLALKERGILVRHFDGERIADYNRITVGTKEQMDTLIKTLRIILEERK